MGRLCSTIIGQWIAQLIHDTLKMSNSKPERFPMWFQYLL